ncbi:phosphonoacetaldehyde hydrolase [Aerococcaceae bacterium 50-4]
MIKLVIFDWAGTTVDFGSMAPVNAIEQLFNEYEIPVTDEEIRKPMGTEKREHLSTMLGFDRIRDAWVEKFTSAPSEEDVDKMYARFKEILIEGIPDNSHVKPGTVETVAQLRERGIKIGTTTGYNREMAQLAANTAKAEGFDPDFTATVTDTNNIGRPFPYMIFKNMEALNVLSVKEVVKVGDTLTDIEEGINAGAIAIGLIEGSSQLGLKESELNALSAEAKDARFAEVREAYKQVGAHYVVDTMSDLIEIIDNLNK